MSSVRRIEFTIAASVLAAVAGCRGEPERRADASPAPSPAAAVDHSAHAGHTPEEHARALAAQGGAAPADPHAAHRAPAAAADPHAAHRATPVQDPHAGHRPSAGPDPHAGHRRSAAGDPHAAHRPGAAADPHAGHRPAAVAGPHAAHQAPPAADPHAGHGAATSAAPVHDPAAMGHAPAPPRPAVPPPPATAVATPGQPAATLDADALDAPAPTSVKDARRAAEAAVSGHAMSHGTYRQVDAGREDVPITSPVGAARRGSAPVAPAADPHAGHAMPAPSPSPEERR